MPNYAFKMFVHDPWREFKQILYTVNDRLRLYPFNIGRIPNFEEVI